MELTTVLQTFPFTPEGQAQLIERLMEQGRLDDRRFRSIHPRNTGLIAHIAYMRRQSARHKSFRRHGSSQLIHRALLQLLLAPEAPPPMPPLPSPSSQKQGAAPPSPWS